MKRIVFSLAIIVAILGSVAYVSAQDEPDKPAAPVKKAEKGILVGTAVEFSTFAMKGLEAEDFAEAAKNRAEQGFPVGIIDGDTGEAWICVYRDNAPASHLETANEQLAPYMGMKVVVTGLMYKTENVNVIRCSLISEY